MKNSKLPYFSTLRYSILFIGFLFVIIGFVPQMVESGIDTPTPIGKFLNGNLPLVTPQDGGTQNAPTLLSQTGAFSDLVNLTPSQGLIPYDMIEPFWSDGAEKYRWMAVPNNGTHNTASEQIVFSENDSWDFPKGSVLIKHFEIGDRRLETRFEVKGDDDVYYYLTYRWNINQTDAVLLEGALDEEITVDGQTQIWHYPSRAECIDCHMKTTGSVLGLKTRYLNKSITYPSTGLQANQLVTLSHLGVLDVEITDATTGNYFAIAAKDNLDASLEYRARSYLDVNCSYCHQPATANRAQFDARISTPLDAQNVINGAVLFDLGLMNPRTIVPQHIDQSAIHYRMNALENGIAMPPIAKNVVDEEGVQLITNWINSLSATATDELVVTGVASQSDGGCYNITPDLTNQVGAAWYSQAIDFSEDVSIRFAAMWGAENEGAEGMALVFQNQGTTVDVGIVGEGFGASEISPSLGIEFDTYSNNANDMTDDHIAIWTNGNVNSPMLVPVCAEDNCDNIEDGQIHIVKITWDATQKRLSVFFDDEQRIIYDNDFVNTVFGGMSNLYVGVTGSTGLQTAQQNLCSFYVNSAAENTEPNAEILATPLSGTAPLTVNFDATTSSDDDGDDLTFQWNFGDGEIASGGQSTHTYTAAGTYTALLTVSDGQTNSQTSVAVVVHEGNSNGTQVMFSDQTTLLQGVNYSGVAMAVVDMNGDKKDDLVRFDKGRTLNIQYQTTSNQPFDAYVHGQTSNAQQWTICIADVDRDGRNDILAGGAYDNVKIVRNNNGYDDYTVESIPNSSIFIQGSNFADINNDGWIDAFACHDDGESRAFRNNQSGGFVYDADLIETKTNPISDNSGNYGSVWTDYDNDGDLDLYLSKCRIGVHDSNDPRRINMLWQNDGNHNFTEVSATANLKIGAQSWATDFGDIDNDGDLDALVINHYESNQLMRNNGDGTFTDITANSGLFPALEHSNAYGVQALFRDFNNDGYVDLIFTGTKHFLFYNNGNGLFSVANNPFNDNQIESVAIGDLNHDGFLDVYAGYANLFNNPSDIQDRLFFNQGNSNNFIAIQLEGIQSNINGIGARVELYGAWGVQIREVRAGEGYGIMNTLTQHFGLGTANQIDKILVRWPSGIVQEIPNPSINQFLTIIETEACTMEGQVCDDGDDCTENDVYDTDCNCVGMLIDENNNGICDLEENNCETGQYPYNCVERDIPGLFKAVEYDEGGEGVAYHDDGVRNGDLSFRPNDKVDAVGGIVGWTKSGEWLEYTVQNIQTGTYAIELSVASASSNPGNLNVLLEDNLLATFDVQGTGGWGNYTILTIPNVYLEGGTNQVLRLSIFGGSYNLNTVEFILDDTVCTEGESCDDGDACTENDIYDADCNCVGVLIDENNNGICDLTEQCDGGQYPFECNWVTIPATIQVENYDEGGEGIAYHDDAVRNGDMSFRPTDKVDVIGGAVGWIRNGEWLEYTINTTAGQYDIHLHVASGSSNPGLVNVSLDEEELGSFDIQNTGNWGNYTVLTLSDISIVESNNVVLRLDFVTGSFNMDKIDFELVDTNACTEGESCDDGDDCTENDVFDAGCACMGVFQDSDNDGLCDANDPCPEDPTNTCNMTTYCELRGINTNYEWIERVQLGTIDYTSGNNGGYADFTNISTALVRGQSYDVILTPGFSNASYKEGFRVWIDFNRDGDFEDANEMLWSGEQNGILVGVLNIPSDVMTGRTRMRIAMRWNTAPINPCGGITYGEVEDYSVVIEETSPMMQLRQPNTNNAVLLSPNPTRHALQLEFSQQIDMATIMLFDNTGKHISTTQLLEQTQLELDVQSLEEGLYFVKIQSSTGEVFNKRFIKIR